MKINRYKIIIPALLLTLSLLLPALEGCKTANQTAFAATTLTVDSVNAAVPLWNAYVQSGKATDVQKLQVANSFDAYQLALKTERDAVVSYYANTNSISNYQAFADATKAAQADFLATVNAILPRK